MSDAESTGRGARSRTRRLAPPTSPGTTRVEAFSDGVFAIAATLLVLEIHVPTESQIRAAGSLETALLAQWPIYLAHLATFATIGAIWLNHHAIFRRLARVDQRVLGWNLVLLLGVSFLPFPNALVADELQRGLFTESARTATVLYALVGIACSVPFLLLSRHVTRDPRLLRDPDDGPRLAADLRRGRVGVAGYAGAVVVAVVAPPIAVGCFLAGSVYFALTAGGPAVDDQHPTDAEGGQG